MGEGKITCSTCKFEQNNKCLKKKTKVKMNKKRRCDLYKQDNERVVELAEKAIKNPKPGTIMRPDWYWDKKKTKEIRRQIKSGSNSNVAISADPKHPLTGDLSRFIKSTAVD